MVSVNRHREMFREMHGFEAPPVMTADFTFVHPDAAYAKERAEQYLTAYLYTLLNHYELMSEHFKEIEGYQGYGKQADVLQKIGMEGYVKGFLAANAYGTPDHILARLEERRAVVGEFEQCTCFRFGGI